MADYNSKFTGLSVDIATRKGQLLPELTSQEYGSIQTAAWPLTENGNVLKAQNGQLVWTDTVPNATNAINATYASADHSKGTIEERLTSLGFSEGYITPVISGVSIDQTKKLKRQGNYSCIDFGLGQDYDTQEEAIYHDITDSSSTYQGYFKIGTLPLEYRPKEQTDLRYICRCYGWLLGSHTRALDKMCIIKASTGEIFLDNTGSSGYYYTITYAQLRGTAGFECNPRA